MGVFEISPASTTQRSRVTPSSYAHGESDPAAVAVFGGPLYIYRNRAHGYVVAMCTITAILEADEDGTLHLPVPPELRKTKVRVTATLKAAAPTQPAEDRTPLRALKELRKLGAFKEMDDPIDWQRPQRRDHSLPGRE